MAITFQITPVELIAACYSKITIVRTRGRYLTAKHCPACGGGRNRDTLTFIVHKNDGNFKCVRTGCQVSGNFWQLFELLGLDPRHNVAAYSKDNNTKPYRRY